MLNCRSLIKLGLSIFLFHCTSASFVYGQEIIKPNVTNYTFLKNNGIKLLAHANSARSAAMVIAKKKGWDLSRADGNGNTLRLQRLDDLGLPIYYTTTNNVIAAGTTRTHKLYSGGGLGLALNGKTIAAGKVAIWDIEGVLSSHIEFAGNRIEVRDKTTTTAQHSTHVAGTMIASGLNPIARGMAFGLPKLYVFNFDNDTPEMSANAAGLLISNHSYGVAAGWSLNTSVSPQRWEFFGAPGANEDYKFGYYDNETSEWDKICFNAPYYLPVKSAGNNRSVNGPAVGMPYFRYNADRVMSSAGLRPEGISNNDSYDNISTYGTAKNILTIGAINPLASGPYTAENIKITAFSSWGPTDDGRIKPDLVADGIRVTSTSDANNSSYATLSGTSMSTPNVSGSLILLQELYNQQHPNSYMRSATLKALVIGTAAETGIAPGPDYSYGWGLLNMEAAAQALLDENTKSKIYENALKQGEQQFITVTASADGPLTATICWTDPEAVAISTANTLNNQSTRLINDLDLRVVQQSTTIYPWILDPSKPSAPASTGDNIRDNVEQIKIAEPIAGSRYTFKVSHKGSLKRGPQNYSIVITGINGETAITSNRIVENDHNLNMIVYPVPAKNEVSINFEVPSLQNISLRLINISGQQLYQESKSNFIGTYSSQLNLSSYPSGLYFILVKVGEKTYTKKFICVK